MTEQLTFEVDCPTCKKPHAATVDLPELVSPRAKNLVRERSEPMQPLQDLDSIIDKKLKEKEPKPVETPKPKKEKVVAPAYQPRFICNGAGCEGHDNPNYQMRPQKRCTNCNMWGGPASVKKCPTCGSEEDFEEVDEDELDTLNIPRPQHRHSHEEEEQ